jgi:hypothetical protein
MKIGVRPASRAALPARLGDARPRRMTWERLVYHAHSLKAAYLANVPLWARVVCGISVLCEAEAVLSTKPLLAHNALQTTTTAAEPRPVASLASDP